MSERFISKRLLYWPYVASPHNTRWVKDPGPVAHSRVGLMLRDCDVYTAPAPVYLNAFLVNSSMHGFISRTRAEGGGMHCTILICLFPNIVVP